MSWNSTILETITWKILQRAARPWLKQQTQVTDLPLIPPSKSSEPGAASWVLGSSNARRVRPAEWAPLHFLMFRNFMENSGGIFGFESEMSCYILKAHDISLCGSTIFDFAGYKALLVSKPTCPLHSIVAVMQWVDDKSSQSATALHEELQLLSKLLAGMHADSVASAKS